MVYLLPYFLESWQKRFIEVVAAFFVENASSLLTSYNAINSEYVRQRNCRIRDRMFLEFQSAWTRAIYNSWK